MGLLSPYLGSAKELSAVTGASINRVGGKASFTEAKVPHKTPSAPLSPAAKAHTKSLLTGHYSPAPVVLCRTLYTSPPPSTSAAKKLSGCAELFQDQQRSFSRTHVCHKKSRMCALTASCPSVSVWFSSRDSERTISADNNANLKHLEAGSR